MMRAQVVVAGAGAAGLMAAFYAAQSGCEVVLLEKNARPGLKILISGGGRCNLTTTRSGKDLESQYGTRRGRWLRHALRAFPPTALVDWVEAAGVPLQAEDLEKIFPVSGRARDVLDALLRRCAEVGVQVRYQSPLRSVVPEPDGGFRLSLGDGETLRCDRLILSVGGLSYPKTGATGDGYDMLRELDHTIVEPVPALAPLVVDEPWVHELSGITLWDSALSLRDAGEKLVLRRQRPVLFTHKGLTGPAAMDLAGDIESAAEAMTVGFDFVPEQNTEQLAASLEVAGREHGSRVVENCLPREIPERIRRHLVGAAGASGPVAQLSRKARHRLAHLAKDTRVSVAKSLGFKHAEVTRGGVALDEIDARTMESKRQPGLFVCGELLDVDGPIGGFNFQAAFATGRLAGLAVASANQ